MTVAVFDAVSVGNAVSLGGGVSLGIITRDWLVGVASRLAEFSVAEMDVSVNGTVVWVAGSADVDTGVTSVGGITVDAAAVSDARSTSAGCVALADGAIAINVD